MSRRLAHGERPALQQERRGFLVADAKSTMCSGFIDGQHAAREQLGVDGDKRRIFTFTATPPTQRVDIYQRAAARSVSALPHYRSSLADPFAHRVWLHVHRNRGPFGARHHQSLPRTLMCSGMHFSLHIGLLIRRCHCVEVPICGPIEKIEYGAIDHGLAFLDLQALELWR